MRISAPTWQVSEDLVAAEAAFRSAIESSGGALNSARAYLAEVLMRQRKDGVALEVLRESLTEEWTGCGEARGGDQMSDPRFEGPAAGGPEVEPPHPEPPLWTLSPFYLFFRPAIFFRDYVVRSTPALTALAAWGLGIVAFADRMDRQMLRSITGDSRIPLGELTESWPYYWGFALGAGAISGVLYYLIGGWWYRKRLGFCGAPEADARLARRVYILASAIYVIPFLAYKAWETNHYSSPSAAFHGDDWGAFAVILFLFWSVYGSYRGVRTAFTVRDWPARIWFLLLPSLIYSFALVALIGGMLLAGSSLEPDPRVDSPATIERAGFSLQYPGNWVLDLEDGYDLDSDFAIEPSIADATMRLMMYEGPADPSIEVEYSLEALAETVVMGQRQAIDRWGEYDGAGFDVEGTINGDPYMLRVFVASPPEGAFEIWKIVEEGVADRMEPGFRLIQDTFRRREGEPAVPQ